VHTGWAAMVAIAGRPAISKCASQPYRTSASRRSLPRFVYHKAAELPPTEAADLVKRAKQASQRMARAAMKAQSSICNRWLYAWLLDFPSKTRELATEFASIPSTHSAVILLRAGCSAAIRSGCGKLAHGGGHKSRPRSLDRHSRSFARKRTKLRKQVDAVRESVGPPGDPTRKTATAMALLALCSTNKIHPPL